jgi:hypothetical protein
MIHREGKGSRSVVLLALAALGLALPAGAQATSLDTYVLATAPDDVPPCTQLDPCQHIATALTDTDPGGTVHVGPGTYSEHVNVSGGRSVLCCEGDPFGEGMIISPDAQPAVTVDAGQTAGVIKGFTLRATGPNSTAAALFGDGTFAWNHFDATDHPSTGLATQPSAHQDIEDNRFIGDGFASDRTGLSIDGSPAVGNNKFSGLGVAIDIFPGSPPVFANQIYSSAPGGIGVRVRATTSSSMPFIEDNQIDNVDTAIQLQQLSSSGQVGASLIRDYLRNDGSGLYADNTKGPVTLERDLFAGNGTSITARDVPPLGDDGDVTATKITVWNGSFGATVLDAALTIDSSIFGDGIYTTGTTDSCSIVYSRGPVSNPADPTGCSDFQTTADPQFAGGVSNVDPALNCYCPIASSPMIDQGNPALPGGFGGTCTSPPRVDIGAFEYEPQCRTWPTSTIPPPVSSAPAKKKKCKKHKRRAAVAAKKCKPKRR